MLRRIARSAGCAAVALLLVPAAASAAFGDRPLRMGMHGKDVRVLQMLLTKAGYSTRADGRFGRRTRRAAGRWEAARDRLVNGRLSRIELLALRREFDAPISTPVGEGVVDSLVRFNDAGASKIATEDDLHADVFPIDGPHDLGRNEANRFGGGRGHKGQDMFADCGTPVIAARGGRVAFSGYDGAAGNYLVIRAERSGEDYVYMHLLNTPRLHEGDRVEKAQRIGSVGRTGDADGCHLHFEIWTRPGWYRGGHPYDPLSRLSEWDRWS